MVGLNRFLGLALLSVAMVAPALSEEPYQPWIKKGCILAPGFAGEKSNRLLSAPCVVKLENGELITLSANMVELVDRRHPQQVTYPQ